MDSHTTIQGTQCPHPCPLPEGEGDSRQRMGEGGFTIVEMSVVVFVIGLIIVGITAGKNLLDGGKTRAVISELDDYRQAILQFQEKYQEFPGDMIEAGTLWPGEEHGNGDERIDWDDSEGALAWRHLELAEMIGQTGMSSTLTQNAVIGETVPDSKMPGAGWFIDYEDSVSGNLGNHLGIGAQQSTGINNAPVLPAKRAADIDTKVDDGFPSTGLARSTGDSTADKCVSGTAYQIEETIPGCTSRFSIKN